MTNESWLQAIKGMPLYRDGAPHDGYPTLQCTVLDYHNIVLNAVIVKASKNCAWPNLRCEPNAIMGCY